VVWRLKTTVERSEVIFDHPQWEVVVALRRQYVAQPLHVIVRKLAISRRRALGLDETLRLEEPDFGDGDVGEVGPKMR